MIKMLNCGHHIRSDNKYNIVVECTQIHNNYYDKLHKIWLKDTPQRFINETQNRYKSDRQITGIIHNVTVTACIMWCQCPNVSYTVSMPTTSVPEQIPYNIVSVPQVKLWQTKNMMYCTCTSYMN